MAEKSYVYKITRNDDLMYIGITIDCKKRFAVHTRSDRFSIGIKNIEILQECDSYEEAEELEEYYISKYDTFASGLNLSINGKGNHLSDKFTTYGYKFSDEARKKMSERAKRRGVSENCRIASKSEKSRKKMSESRKGIAPSNVKVTKEQIYELMTHYRSNLHPFDNNFIESFVTKNCKHLVGKVPIEELISPNGKKINIITLYAKYYSHKFGVCCSTIRNIINNDGKRCEPRIKI